VKSTSLPPAWKTHPYRIAAVALAVLLAAGAWYRGTVLDETAQTYATREVEAKRLADNVVNGSKLPAQLAEAQRLNEAVKERLLNGSDLAANQQYFYRLESETGVKISDLRQIPAAPTAGKKSGVYSSLLYTVSVNGSYGQLMEFLRKLEAGHYICRVMNGSVNARAGDVPTADGELSIQVEFLTAS
jgi:Tfp pilus assembly protein PilO